MLDHATGVADKKEASMSERERETLLGKEISSRDTATSVKIPSSSDCYKWRIEKQKYL